MYIVYTIVTPLSIIVAFKHLCILVDIIIDIIYIYIGLLINIHYTSNSNGNLIRSLKSPAIPHAFLHSSFASLHLTVYDN